MTDSPALRYTSFDGHTRIASGSLRDNALAVKHALERNAIGPVLMFDDHTGRSIDVDLRGSDAAVVARLQLHDSTAPAATVATSDTAAVPAERRGRGRPSLGVTPREVTLLPRHWEWLATQPGGASVTLRKLVEAARKENSDKDRIRQAQERAYHFMSAIAGNLAGFEEATRALFANDRAQFNALVAAWPGDVAQHAGWLAFGETSGSS